MTTRSIGRHVAWVENHLPELANLGQSEVDRVISRSARGITTLRVILYFMAMLLAQPVSTLLAQGLGEISYGWTHRISLIAVLLPLLLLSNFICDQIWRWRIKSAVSA